MTWRGHPRANVTSLDLNRQRRGSDPKDAPEVAAVLDAMRRTGVAPSLDVHGDEALPHVIIEATDPGAGASPRRVAGVDAFKAALLNSNPAFQVRVGCPKGFGGAAAPGICTRAVCLAFDAAAMTLEMPFKDSLEAPDPVRGCSTEACQQLGHDCVAAMLRQSMPWAERRGWPARACFRPCERGALNPGA